MSEALKRCGVCGILKPLSDFAFRRRADNERLTRCRTCASESARAYYQRNGADIRTKVQLYKRSHREDYNRRNRAAYARDRAAVFDYYGRECACCGSPGQLTIDHVHGDGRQHRASIFGRDTSESAKLYRWLIKEGFPAGFQVLCNPCNSSKGTGHVCRLDHATLAGVR